jgi:Leucine-rich repeat (LRR) protein
LSTLNLARNEIRVIENLGVLHSLESLDLTENRLHVLDGFAHGELPGLRELNISHNAVLPRFLRSSCYPLIVPAQTRSTHRAPLRWCATQVQRVVSAPAGLETLHLGDNQLADWNQVQALRAWCPRLRRLVLDGNPICDDPDYRANVVRRLPTLVELDFIAVPEAERALLSLSFEGSSGSSESALSQPEGKIHRVDPKFAS